jgi:hypothetical protein
MSPTNQGYQPTSKDVLNVLSSNPLSIILDETLENLAERLFADLDFQLIEEEALNGDDLDEQTNYANDEIARQLRVSGVLWPELTKEQRLANANLFIGVVANCGRKFFRTNEYVSKFAYIAKDRLVFIDNYTRTPIDIKQAHRWKGFSHGSTLQDLVVALGGYINTGVPPRFNLGNDANEPWGYGKDMAIVRAAAEDHGLRPCKPVPVRSEKYQKSESKIINVQLNLDHKGSGFQDEAAMLRWLSACLNSNVNFAQVSVAVMPEPIVVVEVSGGLIQDMNSSAPVRVIVLDGDTEGSEEFREINGNDCLVTSHASVEVNAEYVELIAQEVDSVEELDEPKVPSESIIQ